MKGYFRRGDAADIAILELVDRPEVSKDRDAGTSDEKQQTEK
jgi:hypothetical protein